MVWYFPGVYTINSILHARLWIYYPLVFNSIPHSFAALARYRVERSKIKLVSTRGHVISSIYSAGGLAINTHRDRHPDTDTLA